METWSDREKHKQVRELLAIADSDVSLGGFVRREYSHNMKRFNALRAACSEYRRLPDGSIERRTPEEIQGGSQGSVLKDEDIMSVLDTEYNRASEAFYSEPSQEMEFRRREIENQLSSFEDGEACQHCIGGEVEEPERYRADGSLIEGTGSPKQCKHCRGTGLLVTGSRSYSKEAAARLRSRLLDAQGLGWQLEPNESEIGREYDNIVRLHSQDPYRIPSHLRVLNPQTQVGRDALLAAARQQAKKRRLLKNPHLLTPHEINRELQKFRNMMAHMDAWSKVESWEDGDPQEQEVHDVVQGVREQAAEDQFFQREVARKVEVWKAIETASEEGRTSSDEELHNLSTRSAMSDRIEKALHLYFLPQSRRMVDASPMFQTTTDYILERELDRDEGRAREAAVQKRVMGLACSFMKDTWHMATHGVPTIHLQDIDEFGVAAGPGETGMEQRQNMERFRGSWNTLGAEEGGEAAQKAVLNLFVGMPHEIPFLSLVLHQGDKKRTLPPDAARQMASVIYAGGNGVFGKETGVDNLSQFLTWGDTPSRSHERSQDIGEEPAKVDDEERNIEDDKARGYSEYEDVQDIGPGEERGIHGDRDVEEYEERVRPDELLPTHTEQDKASLIPSLDPIVIPVQDPSGNSLTLSFTRLGAGVNTLLREWDRHNQYHQEEGGFIQRPVRDEFYITMLHDLIKSSGSGPQENLADRQRTDIATVGSQELLAYLSGAPEPGALRRHYLDDLLHHGQFRSGETVRFGKRVTNNSEWRRMEKLRRLLLHENGAQKQVHEVAESREFLRMFNKDAFKQVGQNMPVEEQRELRAVLTREEALSGTLEKCGQCNKHGVPHEIADSRGLGPGCRHIEGENEGVRECSGLGTDRVAPGMMQYTQLRTVGTQRAKDYFTKLQRELLGVTTYGDPEGETEQKTGMPDKSHLEATGTQHDHHYEPGLLQRAEDFDKALAARLNYWIPCPQCGGSGEHDGVCGLCQSAPRGLSKQTNGQFFVPDTRHLRDLHGGFRAGNLGARQSVQSLLARRRMYQRYSKRAVKSQKITRSPEREAIRSSLDSRFIPADEGVTPYEYHPIFKWQELHRPGGALTAEGLLARKEQASIGVDQSDYMRATETTKALLRQTYREIFSNIPTVLEGFERDVLENTSPGGAVDSEWFKELLEELVLPGTTAAHLEEHLQHVHRPDVDGRNMHLDEGLMETGPCSDCAGTGSMRWPQGRINHYRPCEGCRGTQSEGVRKQLLRNPHMFDGLTGDDIRRKFALGDLDREHRGHRSVFDNAHISATHCPCGTCSGGLPPEIYEGGGWSDESPAQPNYYQDRGCRKCGKPSMGEDKCECVDGFRASEPTLLWENQRRTRKRGASLSPIFSKPDNLAPTFRRTSLDQDRRQAAWNELYLQMRELRRFGQVHGGRGGGFGETYDRRTRESTQLELHQMEQKMQDLVDMVRDDDVRDAWRENVGEVGALPDFNLRDENGELVDWRKQGGTHLLASPLVEKLKLTSGIRSDEVWNHPCPYCLQRALHHPHMDVPTLGDHKKAEEKRLENTIDPMSGKPQIWVQEQLECPVARAEFEKQVAQNGNADGADEPPRLWGMRDFVLKAVDRSPEENMYESLMGRLEPAFGEAARLRREGAHQTVMKTLKPMQSLAVPLITPIPPAMIVSSRLASLGGRNLFGRGSPMSPSSRLSRMFPESLSSLSSFLRAVEEQFPDSPEETEKVQRLLAMHIVDPSFLTHDHGNLLGYPPLLDGLNDLREGWRNKLEEAHARGSYLGHEGKAAWALTVLGKRSGEQIGLTSAERREFRENYDVIQPFLGLEYEWQKYLTPNRKWELQRALGEEHPLLEGLFNFELGEASAIQDSLFVTLMHSSMPDVPAIELVLDALNASAQWHALNESSAHFGADEHGYMQPYENNPSMWHWWHSQEKAPNPELLRAWLHHDDETLRQYEDGKWVVTGKTWGDIRESGLLDTLWQGITGGKPVVRAKWEKKPGDQRPKEYLTEVMSGTTFPTLDEMVKLGPREHNALKGAWYHLRKEIVLRSANPDLSRRRLLRAGHFFAPVGLNTLGTASRCLACSGHGQHHNIDEAAVWYGIAHPHYDRDGNRTEVPSVVLRDEDGEPLTEVGSDGKERWRRKPLKTLPGSRRIDWSDPDSIRFIHENLMTPYEHEGEEGWAEYLRVKHRHNMAPDMDDQEIKDREGNFTNEYVNWLTAHEFGCLACDSTGHCGGCGGSGEEGRTAEEHQAVQDINLALLMIQNRGLGNTPDSNGMMRHIPQDAQWFKPDDGSVSRYVESRGVGQYREYLDPPSPEHEPMDLITADNREFTIPGSEDYAKEFEEEKGRLSRLRGVALLPEEERLKAEENIEKDIHASLGRYQDWRLDKWVEADPEGYYRDIQGSTRKEGGAWPTGTFDGFIAQATGSKTHPQLTRRLMSMNPHKLAGLLYAFHQRRLSPTDEGMPSWWTRNHEMGLNKTGLIFPENHFPRTGMRPFPSCEHPDCDSSLDPVGEHTNDECVYCNGTGDLNWNVTDDPVLGDEKIQCMVCDGKGEFPQKLQAMYGPEMPGELHNPHGAYCAHHHPIMIDKMNTMHEDFDRVSMNIAGGNFAHKLLKYTSLDKSDLWERMQSRNPEALPPEEIENSGLGHLLSGLSFLGFHRVDGRDGQEDYYIPMFEKDGSKFSLFDLGEGHLSDYSGLGVQNLWQERRPGGTGRHIDHFDSPGWAYGPGNPMKRIRVAGNEDSQRDIRSIEPSKEMRSYGNQYAYPSGKIACPHCQHLLDTTERTYLNEEASKEAGERVTYSAVEQCLNRMSGSVHDKHNEGICGWPGNRYDRKFLGEQDLDKEMHSRDFIIGSKPSEKPQHVIERDHRERLRHRVESILDGLGDPAMVRCKRCMDENTGESTGVVDGEACDCDANNQTLDPHERTVYHLIQGHHGRVLRYEKGHKKEGQPVYESVKVPGDAPFCSWYRFNGVPSLHDQHDARLSKPMHPADFCERFKSLIINYDDDGRPRFLLDKEGNPTDEYEIDKADLRLYKQLQQLLRVHPEKHPLAGQKVHRYPEMHPGMGSSLGQHGDVEKDGYQGLSSRSAVKAVYKKVNKKIATTSHDSTKQASQFLSQLSSIVPTGRFDTMAKICTADENGNVIFKGRFLDFMNKMPKLIHSKRHHDLDTVKEVDAQYRSGKVHRMMAEHLKAIDNKRMMIRIPRDTEDLVMDKGLTAYTTSDPNVLQGLLTSFSEGQDAFDAIVSDQTSAQERAWATGTTDPVNGASLRPNALTFGVRPDRYHELMEEYAAEAHENALEFQTTHFPHQSVWDSMNRPPRAREVVDERIRSMRVLGASNRMDLLSEGQRVANLVQNPGDQSMWYSHSGIHSPNTPVDPDVQEREWQQDEFKEGWGDTGSEDYEDNSQE